MTEKKSSFNILENQIINKRYKIIKLIGTGSFSSVFRVFDQKMQMEKVLKILAKGTDRAFLSSDLYEEARILAQLNHENIVRIYDFNDESEFIFLDMEFVDGNNLREYLKEHKISKEKSIDLATDICKGMIAAHEKNIIHQDIKPENILIDKNEKVKISDFGIAENMQKSKLHKQQMGTYAYMSPEKLHNGETSIKSDIFAFGVLFYEMYFHKYPFISEADGKPQYKIPKNILKSKKAINAIIAKCLSLEPDERYESFNQILLDIQNLKLQKKGIFENFINRGKSIPIEVFQEIKRDLLFLGIILILLLGTLPFYLQSIREVIRENEKIQVDSVPLKISVNMIPKGFVPNKLEFEKGDFIQFYDLEGNEVFNMIYNNEPKLELEQIGNKIILNNAIIGMIINSPKDFPLPQNLSYLRLNIPFTRENLNLLNRQNLSINMSENLKDSLLMNLPETIISLNLQNNIHINRDSKLLRFPNLQNLIISGIPNLSLKNLSVNQKLTSLNLSKISPSNFMDVNKILSLKNLDLSNNSLSEISMIKNLKQLENLNIENNDIFQIKDFYGFPKLKLVNLAGNLRIKQQEIDRLDKSLKKHRVKSIRYIQHKRENSSFVSKIKYLLLLLFIVAIVLLYRILQRIIKMKHKIDNRNPLPKKKISNDHDFRINQIITKLQTNIAQNQIVYPLDDCALKLYCSLNKKQKAQKKIRIIKKIIDKTINESINNHLQIMEFEPAYLLSNRYYLLSKDKKMKKKADSISKKMQHISEIKFIKIKGGSFQMGDFSFHPNKNSLPVHTEKVEDFNISETAITNKQFCDFLNVIGEKEVLSSGIIKIESIYCKIELKNGIFYPIFPYESFPIIEVNWYGAVSFAKWIGGKLPSESEWEFAARNKGDKIHYSFGDVADPKKGNYLLSQDDERWHSIRSVKTYQSNSLGLYEMSGNVMEWCRTSYSNGYDNINEKSEKYVLRGGAWCFTKDKMKNYYRGSAKAKTRNNYIGFRVVKDPEHLIS